MRIAEPVVRSLVSSTELLVSSSSVHVPCLNLPANLSAPPKHGSAPLWRSLAIANECQSAGTWSCRDDQPFAIQSCADQCVEPDGPIHPHGSSAQATMRKWLRQTTEYESQYRTSQDAPSGRVAYTRQIARIGFIPPACDISTRPKRNSGERQ